MTKPGELIHVKPGDDWPVILPTSITDQLRRPFDPKWINRVDKGSHSEDYVNHAVVTNRLNMVLGVDGWSFRVIDVLTFNDDKGVHVAHVLGEMTVGAVVRQEIGVPKRVSQYHEEIKTAVSDAVKRCAMRYGVAIQLWHEVEESGAGVSEEASASGPSHPTDEGQGQEGPVGGTSEATGDDRTLGKVSEKPPVADDVQPLWDELITLTKGDYAKARRAIRDTNVHWAQGFRAADDKKASAQDLQNAISFMKEDA